MYGKKVHALRGVAMQVSRGEIFGLLGPNGAGKSTLVKILMTVIRPTEAVGTVLGHPVGHKATLSRIGYLPEHHRFPRYLTGRQVMQFFAALQGVSRGPRNRMAEGLLDRVGMRAWANERIGTYSKGMMQRIGIGMAMMSTPDLVLLDEPTDGVDPVGRRDIRDILLDLRRRGTAVFVNSHLLSELEMVCDRVAIMMAGQVIREGRVDELLPQDRYEIELAQPVEGLDTALTGIGIKTVSTGNALWCQVAQASDLQPAIDLVRARGGVISRIGPHRASLEDLFIQLYQQVHGNSPTAGAQRS